MMPMTYFRAWEFVILWLSLDITDIGYTELIEVVLLHNLDN